VKIDQTKEPSTGTVVGWMVLALGMLIWLSVIPLTGTALELSRNRFINRRPSCPSLTPHRPRVPGFGWLV
jgi:hypothetical protein